MLKTFECCGVNECAVARRWARGSGTYSGHRILRGHFEPPVVPGWLNFHAENASTVRRIVFSLYLSGVHNPDRNAIMAGHFPRATGITLLFHAATRQPERVQDTSGDGEGIMDNCRKKRRKIERERGEKRKKRQRQKKKKSSFLSIFVSVW